MQEIFLMYLWTRLDALINVFVAGAIISGVLIFIRVMFWEEQFDSIRDKEEREAKVKATFKPLITYMLVFITLAVLTPDKKDVAIIACGWLTSEAIKSDVAKDIGEKTYRLILGKLDEAIGEIEQGKK